MRVLDALVLIAAVLSCAALITLILAPSLLGF
jgi:hypothetical protein